jgi:hypothetical protein
MSLIVVSGFEVIEISREATAGRIGSDFDSKIVCRKSPFDGTMESLLSPPKKSKCATHSAKYTHNI